MDHDQTPSAIASGKTDQPISSLDGLLEGCQIIGQDFRYVYVNDAVAKQGKRAKEEQKKADKPVRASTRSKKAG